MTTTDSAHVLVVDDEEDVTEIFSHWLNQKYHSSGVTSGEEAIEYLEGNPDTDVVFLDRRMPSMSGDEVLEEIRSHGFECKVAMITAVDPQLDILEMNFDAYLTKPASKEELCELVDSLLRRSQFDDALQRYYSLVSKQATLKEEHPDHKLKQNDEYQQLLTDLAELRKELDETIDFSDPNEFKAALKDATNTSDD